MNLSSLLTKLRNSNAEFKLKHDEGFFKKIQDKQSPIVTLIQCSDSRVHLEAFYKEPQNQIFVVRNIGNQIINSEGSVDFGIEVLKCPFLMIVGHSGCGAVAASLEGGGGNIESIDKEVASMKLCEKDIKKAVIENLDVQVGYAMRKYRSKVVDNRLIVVSLIYDFKNDYGFGYGSIVLNSVNGDKRLEV